MSTANHSRCFLNSAVHSELVDILLRFLEQIPFDAHVSEEGRGHAHFLRSGAMRGMRRGSAHVLADHFRRYQQRRVALDVGTFHRVDAVRRPNAIGYFKNAQIDTAAAGGAAFDFQAEGALPSDR